MSKFVPVVALCSAFFTCASNAQSTILETAAADGRFQTLVAALKASTAIETLKGDGPFTVFAPTDDAFAKLDGDALQSLLKKKNRAVLDDILTYHVVPGALRARDVVARASVQTANGQSVSITTHGDEVRIDGAKVLIADIACENGVIHVVDTVLMPETRALPEIANQRYFGTLVAAVKAAGLLDALAGDGPFTVLAPTDEAFAQLPKGTVENLLKKENRAQLQEILEYHVIPGRVTAAAAIAAGSADTLQGAPVGFEIAAGRLRVQGANVTRTDVDAKNGIVHVIDRVLLPPKPARPQGRLVIGVHLDHPSAALASQLGIDRAGALLISSVTEGSRAEAAGLRPYDVITAIDGHPATDNRLTEAKKKAGYDGQVHLEIVRRGKHLKVPVGVGVADE